MIYLFQNSTFLQYFVVGFGALNIINSGMIYGWPAAFLPQLQNPTNEDVEFHITAAEGSWVAIGSLLGVLVGSPIAACCLDHIGRRRIILFTVFPYFASWIIVATSSCFEMLFSARVIAGISDGLMYTSFPLYIGEIASPKMRGLLGSALEISILIGVILINILALILSLSRVAIFASTVPIISFIGMLAMPESPYFLLLRNCRDDAEAALKFIRVSADVEDELNDIQLVVLTEKQECKGTVRNLLTVPSTRKAFLIILLLRGTQQLTGIKAFVYYFPIILRATGLHFSPLIANIIGFSIFLMSSLLGSYFVDVAGRRKLIICSLIGAAVALTVEGAFFQLEIPEFNNAPIIIIAMLTFVIFYGFGLQIVPVVMIGELFSLNVKSAANCLEEMFTVIVAVLATVFFQSMISTGSTYIAFYIFAFLSVTSCSLLYVYLPETRGITLEEIQCLLKTNEINMDANND